MFERLGVKSEYDPGGVTLNSSEITLPDRFDYDFTGCPDLVQTCAVTLCAKGIPFTFTGTQTLRIKETDRIHALEVELKKIGFILQSDPVGKWISWDGTMGDSEEAPVIKTYHDHRMAMAFAPLALKLGRIGIQNPSVVTKSYPGYWKDLEDAGFNSPFCALNSEGFCD